MSTAESLAIALVFTGASGLGLVEEMVVEVAESATHLRFGST